jgi:predicted phage terminase large subunit-like protein
MSENSPIGFDKEELETFLRSVDVLDEHELLEIEKMLEELDRRAALQAAKDDLIAFCKRMDPNYIVGRHHRLLADQLMAIERGEKDRICVNIPPRHGKSQLVSTYYPAWFIGRNPGKKVMLVSHTTDLAVDFGRKVRNLIDSEAYEEIFPQTKLSTDSKSAGRWNTTTSCEFYATGVGSALAGRGADLLLVDDPHSEQDVLSGNFSVFEKAYEWFAFGARTRLMPGGRVAIVHCMTGDTGVLMSDGTEKALRDVRPGDMVASYKDGALVSKKILNWASQGLDCVYAINTTCGKTVRANERHPFLVDRGGELTWTKVRDLRPGDSLVSLRHARALLGPRQNPENAKRANPRTHGIESIQTHRAEDRIIGVSFVENSVLPKDAKLRRTLKAYASATITKLCGLLGRGIAALTEIATPILNIGTASRSPNIAGCGMRRTESAPFVVVRRGLTTLLLTGKESWRSTIATTLREFERSFATRATSSLGMGPRKTSSCGLFSTSEIISITPDGDEEVFDIQVEGTENFIANGVVSHNTRWHQDDLTGRLVRDMTNNEDSDQYEVVEFPAILDVAQKDKETGQEIIIQKPLWPEFFDLAALLRTKASMPVFQWNAQYQQNPTGEEAAIIKREWWRIWPDDDPPHLEYIIMSLDAAAEANNRADYTSLTTWGVFYNEEEHMHQIILLNAIKRRMEFPELKAMAMEEYKEWEPDSFIVEKKSSGTPLYQEMRRAGLMVQEYTPVRGTQNNPNTKMARLNSVSDIIASGLVWVPPKRWAEELVEEVAAFPFGSNDDQVDTTIMALMRFRQGGFIRLPTDEPDEPLYYRGKVDYY